MRRSLLLGACLAALSAPIAMVEATAAPMTKIDGLSSGSVVEKVQYHNYCRRWRHECASRWGWGTWRYHRCLKFHGCA